jgi:diguanylate cyclase (GGDEF)-like protein
MVDTADGASPAPRRESGTVAPLLTAPLIGGWIRGLRGLVRAIDPPIDGREAAYRQQYLKADATQAAWCIGLMVVPLLFFSSTDYLLFGWSMLLVLVGLLRLSLTAISVGIVLRLRQVQDPQTYDRLIAVWMVAACGIVMIINMTRPPTFIQPVMLFAVLVLALFVLIPNQTWHRFLLAGSYLTTNLTLFLTGRRVAEPITANLLWGAVLLAIIIGFAASSHLSRSRRRQFVARAALEHIRDEFQEMTTVDALTGLLNRRRFLEVAAEELARSRRYGRALSIIAVDLDHFRSVNDGFGQAVGDDVLKALARTLQKQTRRQDIVGRVGGEEFAAILPETSIETAIALAERIRSHLRSMTITTSSVALTVTASLGVAEVAPADRSLADVLHRADQALYRAKRYGRDRVEAA